MKKFLTIIFSVIAVLVIAAAGFLFFMFSAPQSNAATESLTVDLGTTQSALVPKLQAQGFIRNSWAFLLVLDMKGWNGKIQPGGYEVSKSMNAFELANVLVNHPYEKWVVVPEGLRKEQVADILQKDLGISASNKQEFLDEAQEGYAFPDTYLLNLDYSGKQIADRMQSQFNTEAADVFQEARTQNIRNDTLVILASLVQREAANTQEMPLIAGIFWNRLTAGMPLQVDSSIQYALGKEGDWWPIVTVADYSLDSPYNTYTNNGKPPAPICSPGLAAMEAIVNPENSTYLYYLHDSSGQIHVATTYAEHQANIQKYLK